MGLALYLGCDRAELAAPFVDVTGRDPAAPLALGVDELDEPVPAPAAPWERIDPAVRGCWLASTEALAHFPPDGGPIRVWLAPTGGAPFGIRAADVAHAAPIVGDGPRTAMAPDWLHVFGLTEPPTDPTGLVATAVARCRPWVPGVAVAELRRFPAIPVAAVWCPAGPQATPTADRAVRPSEDPDLPFVADLPGGTVWSNDEQIVADVIGAKGTAWWTGPLPAAAVWVGDWRATLGSPDPLALVAARASAEADLVLDGAAVRLVFHEVARGHERPLVTRPHGDDTLLARALAFERGAVEYRPIAVRLATRACDAGLAQGCAIAGWNRSYTPGLLEPARGRADLARACDLGSPEGCYGLGGLYAAGLGGAADPVAARRWWDRGCELGSGEACLRVLRGHLDDGVPYLDDRIGALLGRACRWAGGGACSNHTEWATVRGDFASAWLASHGGDPTDLETRMVHAVFRLRWCATPACAADLTRAFAEQDPAVPTRFSWDLYLPTLATVDHGALHAAVVTAVAGRDAAALEAALAAWVALPRKVLPVERGRGDLVDGPRPEPPRTHTPERDVCVLHVRTNADGETTGAVAHLCDAESGAAAEQRARLQRWAPVQDATGRTVPTEFWTWDGEGAATPAQSGPR